MNNAIIQELYSNDNTKNRTESISDYFDKPYTKKCPFLRIYYPYLFSRCLLKSGKCRFREKELRFSR